MICAVDNLARTQSETTDIGTIVSAADVQVTINTAFEGVDVDKKYFVKHLRRELKDDENWWEQALLELFPNHFS